MVQEEKCRQTARGGSDRCWSTLLKRDVNVTKHYGNRWGRYHDRNFTLQIILPVLHKLSENESALNVDNYTLVIIMR